MPRLRVRNHTKSEASIFLGGGLAPVVRLVQTQCHGRTCGVSLTRRIRTYIRKVYRLQELPESTATCQMSEYHISSRIFQKRFTPRDLEPENMIDAVRNRTCSQNVRSVW